MQLTPAEHKIIYYLAMTFGGNDPEVLKIFDDMPSQDAIQQLADDLDCTVRVIEGVEIMKATSRTIEAEEAAWLAAHPQHIWLAADDV